MSICFRKLAFQKKNVAVVNQMLWHKEKKGHGHVVFSLFPKWRSFLEVFLNMLKATPRRPILINAPGGGGGGGGVT